MSFDWIRRLLSAPAAPAQPEDATAQQSAAEPAAAPKPQELSGYLASGD